MDIPYKQITKFNRPATNHFYYTSFRKLLKSYNQHSQVNTTRITPVNMSLFSLALYTWVAGRFKMSYDKVSAGRNVYRCECRPGDAPPAAWGW